MLWNRGCESFCKYRACFSCFGVAQAMAEPDDAAPIRALAEPTTFARDSTLGLAVTATSKMTGQPLGCSVAGWERLPQ